MIDISLILPASGVEKDQIDSLISLLETHGFRAVLENFSVSERYFSGSDSERLFQLHQSFLTPKTQAVFCVYGGYGSLRLLDKIDYSLLQSHPKPFFGLSDITALQNAFYCKAGIPSFTGFNGTSLLTRPTAEIFYPQIFSILNKKPFYAYAPYTFGSGSASGVLVGGNLSLFTRLLGTPYLPDLKGRILVLEECQEAPYRIDRMLTHLRLAGVFEQISGVILGSFFNCSYKGTTIEAVLEDFFKDLKKPVLSGLNYGHSGNDTLILPIGKQVHLDTKTHLIHSLF